METGKLFSFGLIALVLLACPFTEPPQESGSARPEENGLPPSQPEQLANSTAPPPLPPEENAQLEAQWAMITNQNVEAACLSSAKNEAVAAGYPESLVFSCACTPNEGSGAKAYSCSVSAADGAHMATIACVKSQQSCQISSEKGTYTYTFEEIEQMWG